MIATVPKSCVVRIIKINLAALKAENIIPIRYMVM